MISIDVCATSIKCADISVKGDNVFINKTAIIDIEDNLFDSEQNLNLPLFEDYLKKAFVLFNSRDVCISYSCMPQLTNEYTLIYDKDPKKMVEIVKSKVFTTLSVDEYVMDYKILNIFTQENVKKCSVITYVVPKTLVRNSHDIIIKLGKRPASFTIAQNSIFNFIKKYIKKDICVFLNSNEKMISLHLFNKPDSIITRTAQITKSTPPQQIGISANYDILGSIGLDSDDTQEAQEIDFNQITELLSKLLQYQTIKNPGKEVMQLYLVGDNVTLSMKQAIQEANGIPVLMLSEANINNIRVTGSQIDLNKFIYCIGNVIGN